MKKRSKLVQRKADLEELLSEGELRKLYHFAFRYAYHEANYLKVPTNGEAFEHLCSFRKNYFIDIMHESLFNPKIRNPFKYKIKNITYITEDEIKKQIKGYYKK